jgi:hypothetical protein
MTDEELAPPSDVQTSERPGPYDTAAAPIRPDHPALVPMPQALIVTPPAGAPPIFMNRARAPATVALRERAKRNFVNFHCDGCGVILLNVRAHTLATQKGTQFALYRQNLRRHVTLTGCSGKKARVDADGLATRPDVADALDEIAKTLGITRAEAAELAAATLADLNAEPPPVNDPPPGLNADLSDWAPCPDCGELVSPQGSDVGHRYHATENPAHLKAARFDLQASLARTAAACEGTMYPDTATGNDLDELGALVGVGRRDPPPKEG